MDVRQEELLKWEKVLPKVLIFGSRVVLIIPFSLLCGEKSKP